ncbi:GAF and ANTAR domain-containing protein [Nocardioides dongkuii]|uniref:GAF and ANTAR domain-containing protein n=1 Tax=Nocardioides dongkuii TaxID=2760089 RepID=UPI0018778B16|nr:GAF and ANTAR domain-containing protein [Nocardioides dongkuii]
MSELPPVEELATVFARMSGLLLSEETVSSALVLVTALTMETLPETAGAGITLVDQGGRRTSAAATDERVERADLLQYELDEGPCLTAWSQRQVIRIDDVHEESRWPRWCAAVTHLQVRSALSAPLVAGDHALGAMKVYADAPGAYGPREEHLLSMFARQASILIANVQSYENAHRLSEGLRTALRSRDLIGQAKGMVMQREGVDEESAFAILTAASQHQNRKVTEVAQALVDTATRRRP